MSAAVVSSRAPFDLRGSAALVTGAGRGIGQGIAIELAKAGADVAVVSRTPDELRAVKEQVEEFGVAGSVHVADLRRAEEIASLVDDSFEKFPHLDILVNNAGLLIFGKPWEFTQQDIDDTISTNLTAPFLLSQAIAARWIHEGTPGRIVNITSVESVVPYPDQSPYAATKGGLLTATKVMATELGGAGIRVNAIGPGPIDTELSRRFKEQSEAGVVFGRLGETAEVGLATVFLASDASSFVTGTILYVDGGYMLS